MEYALVYWIREETTSIVKSSDIIGTREIGPISWVTWAAGNPPAAYEARIIAISKNLSLLEEKASFVTVESGSNTGAASKCKKRGNDTTNSVSDAGLMKTALKKGKMTVEQAKTDNRMTMAKDIFALSQNNSTINESDSYSQTLDSASDTMSVICANMTDNISSAENMMLQNRLDRAHATISQLENTITLLRAELDARIMQDCDILAMKNEIAELKAVVETTKNAPPQLPGTPSKSQFLRSIADIIDYQFGHPHNNCDDNQFDFTPTSYNVAQPRVEPMVELESGTGVLIGKFDRTKILLRAKGDPGLLVAMTLEKLFTTPELAEMSACGKRGKHSGLNSKVHSAILGFLERNTLPDRLKNFDFVRCLNNKFGSARRILRKEGASTSTLPSGESSLASTRPTNN